MRSLSFVLSFLLHFIVAALAILSINLGGNMHVRLDRPVYEVNLYSDFNAGRPGAMNKGGGGPEPALGPAPEPQVQEAAPPAPEPVKEIPKPEPKPEPKPVVKQPDVKDISPKKTEEKPKEPERKKEPEKPKTPEKPKESTQDMLKKALGEIKQDIKKSEPKQQPASSSLEKELAALRKDVAKRGGAPGGVAGGVAGGVVGGQVGATGGGGGGGSGQASGLVQVYAQMVEGRVKQNWRYPKVGNRNNLIAQVEITLAMDGSVASARLLKSSGRTDYDASVLRAVEDTRDLPPPPNKSLRVLMINFNLQDMQ